MIKYPDQKQLIGWRVYFNDNFMSEYAIIWRWNWEIVANSHHLCIQRPSCMFSNVYLVKNWVSLFIHSTLHKNSRLHTQSTHVLFFTMNGCVLVCNSMFFVFISGIIRMTFIGFSSTCILFKTGRYSFKTTETFIYLYLYYQVSHNHPVIVSIQDNIFFF